MINKIAIFYSRIGNTFSTNTLIIYVTVKNFTHVKEVENERK